MLNHNDRCTGLDYMEETLSYLAIQGWYDIVTGVLSPNNQYNTLLN